MKKQLIYLVFNMIIIFAFYGCKKENIFLNAKPNQALAVPSSLNDLQLLLANEDIFNRNYPALGEISTDDYYLDNSDWQSDYPTSKNAYVWAKSLYPEGTNLSDWNSPYQMVYYSNQILQILPTIPLLSSQQQLANTIKGSACFFRAIALFNLVTTFAAPYNTATAAKDLGVPIPLVPDLTAKVKRATIGECYDQILADLNEALGSLPEQPVLKTQPSKAAVHGLLSRVYLTTQNFNKSLSEANACLAINSQFLDLNTVDPNAFPVFPHFSPEEIFHASLTGYIGDSFHSNVDSTLYNTYSSNDLRKQIWFYDDHGKIEFNSQFGVHSSISTTISTGEMMLNRAECEARTGNVNGAMADLNSLLKTRWKTGTYEGLTAGSEIDALNLILSERRKELVMTGTRWIDLRRLNQDARFAVTLSRKIDGTTYTLPPNDPRYALPIPESETDLNPIAQNSR